MGKNNKAKGFKRVISKFKRLVTEDDNYYDPDAAILKPKTPRAESGCVRY